METKEQNGSVIYRYVYEFTDEQYKKFNNLSKERDFALNFWDEVGLFHGFNPSLIEEVKRKGQKTYWKCIEYVEGTNRRKFTALTRNKKENI